MKKVLLALTLACSLPGQIQITEVMYNPAGTDSPNEFIELYNQSAAAVNVTGWIIADLAAQDLLYDSTLTGSAIIPAGGYGVIFEGDYDGVMYRDKVPVGTTLIYTGTTTIGNALGNTTDALFLIDSSGDTVASMSWATATPAGYSLEKIRLSRPDTADNWTISRDSLGTPGAPNSVRPLACDGTLLVDSLHISDTIVKSGATVWVTVPVANNGRETFSGSVIISENDFPVATASVPELSELERTEVELLFAPVGSGYHDYRITLVVSADADTTNNDSRFKLAVRYDPGLITINEFLPAPAADQREFVELVHLGNTAIDLKNWRVTDNNYGAAYRFAAAVAAPGSYLVATVDSVLFPRIATGTLYLVPAGGFPTLNNDGDQIRLLDPFDTVIDSLTYDQRWNLLSGRSQEKILTELPSTDPASWQVCRHTDGLTPGTVNSVTPLPLDGCILQDSVRHRPQFPEADEDLAVTATVANTGQTPFTANLLIREAGADLDGSETFRLAVGQSLNVTVTISPLISGRHVLELILNLPG
ncbi:MAG: lamin tail domain-containing protein, partial [Candidatus Neomarinimicrobiota bacterium]